MCDRQFQSQRKLHRIHEKIRTTKNKKRHWKKKSKNALRTKRVPLLPKKLRRSNDC